MSAKSLVAELRSFCETTSVRGVPRIFKAKSRPILVVWVLAVLGCAALLGWQVGLVLSRYFQFPVSTLFVQAPSWQRPTFPDITVCNLSPLVYENDFPEKYVDYVNKIKGMINTLEDATTWQKWDDSTRNTLMNVLMNYSAEFFWDLYAPTSYLNQYPLTSSFTFNQNDSLILNCFYFDWYGNPYNVSCMASVQAAWDPIYYKCFTLRLNDTDRQNIRGFSSVLYVDPYLSNQIVNFDINIRNSRAVGARVLIHAPGTAPDMTLGTSISSGMETSIQLSQTTRTRLGSQYTNCTTQQQLKNDNTSAKYTQSYCVNICLQQQYIDKCGCVSNGLQYTVGQLRKARFILCGNTSRADFLVTYLCGGKLSLIPDLDACNAKCVVSCNAYYYESIPSAASWPQLSTQLAFYNTFIQNVTRFGNKFDAFELADENALVNNATALAYLQSLDAAGLIRNNFLQLNVQFVSARFNVQKDVPVFSVDAMGAQIGGVLSLWLGVTVMFLFEIIELIYTFVTDPRRKNTQLPNVSSEQSKL